MIPFKRQMLKLSILAACLAIMLAYSGCKKDKGDDNNVLPQVDILIYPNTTLYQELNIVGGWLYLGEQDGALPPSRGIIVYRLSLDQFMAYERTSPYKPDSCCNASHTQCARLIVDQSSLFVLDTCTNSKFLILDGTPVEGPATRSLDAYFTDYDGSTLYIHD